MSFSNEVKNELARIESQKKCCEKAELLGLLRMSGAVIRAFAHERRGYSAGAQHGH